MPEHPTPASPPISTAEDDIVFASTTSEAARAARTVVLIAGPGRSGTSLMSGILRHIGLHVPEPQVAADRSNPKGFGEPQWVVNFHDTLLKRVNVHAGDARPSAWYDTGKAGTREANRARLSRWLEEQLQSAPSLVIKDPRIAWFLGLWKAAAGRAGARTGTVTMLRPPAEVVVSKNTYYGDRLGDITRLAGWINVMLYTERATRGTPRSFVSYHDLLTDWTREVSRVGAQLRLTEVTHTGLRPMQEIHRFVDPQLHRVRATWDDLVVPPSLREVAQETWEQLHKLTDPEVDVTPVHASLDELRRSYGGMYADAEALAASSIAAAGPAYLRANRADPNAKVTTRAPTVERRSVVGQADLSARRIGSRIRRRLTTRGTS